MREKSTTQIKKVLISRNKERNLQKRFCYAEPFLLSLWEQLWLPLRASYELWLATTSYDALSGNWKLHGQSYRNDAKHLITFAKIFRLAAYKRAWRALRLYAAYRQSRYLAWRADQINLSTKRNNCRKLYRERQYPILRLGESQRGVRILSKRKRGMLLGVKLVKTVPLQYRFQPTSPRDADTANTMLLVIYSAAAVCELPVSLRERGFVPSDCGNKNRSTRKE